MNRFVPNSPYDLNELLDQVPSPQLINDNVSRINICNVFCSQGIQQPNVRWPFHQKLQFHVQVHREYKENPRKIQKYDSTIKGKMKNNVVPLSQPSRLDLFPLIQRRKYSDQLICDQKHQRE